MTACPDKLLLVHGFADGELDAANALALETHLATCAGCRDELARVGALKTVMRAEGVGDVMPADATARLMAALEAADAPATVREAPRERASALDGIVRHIFGWRWASGAVTGLAAGLALAFVVLPQTRTDRLDDQLVASHVRSLMANHLADIGTSDQHLVKPWFNGKIDFAPPAPELATKGFPLAGGRLDYVDRQTVAAIVYRRRHHVINVFIRPAREGGAKLDAADRMEGYNLQRWRAGGLEFNAVSDLNAKELKLFAETYRTAAGL